MSSRHRRVLVIGSGGAGKSTFASRLAALTGLPLIHLDSVYWRPGWTEPSKDDWASTVEQLIAGQQWIMDGNYGGTLERRLAACDTVVFLDLRPWTCLWRVLRRRLQYHGRTRPDMTSGCRERLTWDYLCWILAYPVRRRRAILNRLAELRPDQEVAVLRNRQEVESFLSGSTDWSRS